MFKNEEGFSLLELVVAVGVAGIIAAVALPTFAGLQDKATTTSATYAASASAAEALANSTIGTSGSVNSGASSSTTSGPVSLGITWVAVSTNDGGGNLGGSGSCNVFNWGGNINTIRMYCTPPQSTFDTLASLTPGQPMAVTSENDGNTYNATFVSWDPATKTINVSGLESAPTYQIFTTLSF